MTAGRAGGEAAAGRRGRAAPLAIMTTSSERPTDERRQQGATTPFRFYDNRQKYLAFINTCNEKQVIAAKAAAEIAHVRPQPPALRIFDAGVGDGTVLSGLLRSVHRDFRTVPLLVVGKEISLEDVQLPSTNSPTASTSTRTRSSRSRTCAMRTRRRSGRAIRTRRRGSAGTSRRSTAPRRRSTPSRSRRSRRFWPRAGAHAPIPPPAAPSSCSPRCSVLYRGDHEFLLDAVIPRPGASRREYDFILASQPWRASMPASFKAEKILAPMARSLAPHGRLLTVQSWGRDPALEVLPAAVARRAAVPGRSTRTARRAARRTRRRGSRLRSQPAAGPRGRLPLSDAHAAFGDR